MTEWLLLSAAEYQIRARGGFLLDPSAVIRDALEVESVRKRGVRSTNLTRMRIRTIPARAKICTITNCIDDPGLNGDHWFEVEISADDFYRHAAEFSDIPIPDERRPEIEHLPALPATPRTESQQLEADAALWYGK